MNRRVAAVVPCAGFSSRMQAFKPLLPLGRTTVLGRAVRTLQEAGLSDILVVAGHRASEVQARTARLGATCVVNHEYARGMFSSVQAGLKALPENAGRVLVLPVDIPLVRPRTIGLLLEQAGHAAVQFPTFQGERGHPPVFRADVVPFVLAWQGRGGLRGALQAVEAAEGACDTAVDDANILFDLDTPEDYQEALRRHCGEAESYNEP